MLRTRSQAVGVPTPDIQVAVKLLVRVKIVSVARFFMGSFSSVFGNNRLSES